MSKKLPKKTKKPKLPILPNAKPGTNTRTNLPYRAGMNSGYKGM